MKEYDVFVAGGAVAGPVAAKFCAKQNLKTLLVKQAKVPREKPCSGIQFPYSEKDNRGSGAARQAVQQYPVQG